MANSTDQALFRYVHHTFADNGTSLHPLQRTGQVSANGARSWWGRGTFARGAHIFDSPPARQSIETYPQMVPLLGSPRDPRYMVS